MDAGQGENYYPSNEDLQYYDEYESQQIKQESCQKYEEDRFYVKNEQNKEISSSSLMDQADSPKRNMNLKEYSEDSQIRQKLLQQ